MVSIFQVFAFGENDVGQLGHDVNLTKPRGSLYSAARRPVRVKGTIEHKIVTDISCGSKFSAVLLHNGKVIFNFQSIKFIHFLQLLCNEGLRVKFKHGIVYRS